MNYRLKFSTGWRFTLLFIMVWFSFSFAAAQTAEPVATPPSVARSIFIQPNNPKEGRDPFFPYSSRPYVSSVASNPNTKDLTSLVMVGMSGTPDHPLVIINNITFAVGDEREVVTAQGRIRIRCLQIIGDMAVIESNGQRHQLRYGLKP